MKNTRHYIRFFLPVVLWGAVIFAFSSYPTGEASQIHWRDFLVKKMAHIIEYAVLSTLIYRALINSGSSKAKAALLAVFFSFLYGASDEFHQSFTPGREPALRDVIIDTIGASGAIYTIWKLLPKAPRRLRELAASFQLN